MRHNEQHVHADILRFTVSSRARAGGDSRRSTTGAPPGKFDEYTRYVRDVAEPIDAEAHRRGAFISVTTYMTQDTASAWTHMRVFILPDSAQLRGLSAALDSAGIRLEPDSVKRRLRSEYSAGLRDRVGAATVQILRR
jgi:hypothetical protein